MADGLRLWRARRRHDHIDAVLRRSGKAWLLEFSRNDRLMLARRFSRQASARAEARTRLSELLRAGWIDHW